MSASVDASGMATAVLDNRTVGTCTVGNSASATSIDLYSLDAQGGNRTLVGQYPGTGVCRRSAGSFQEIRNTVPIDLSGMADGWYVVRFQSGSKASGIVNAPSGAWSAEAQFRKVDGTVTGSPAINGSLPFGLFTGFDYVAALGLSDPDGGTVTSATRCCNTGSPDYAVTQDLIEVGPNGEVADNIVTIPAADTAGIGTGDYAEFKVRATDDDGEYSEVDMVLTGSDNVPPEVTAPPDATAIRSFAGLRRAVSLEATDANDGQSVTFSLSGAPEWATIEQTAGNPATGTLVLAPPRGTTGTFTFGVVATDDDASLPASSTSTLTVRVEPGVPRAGAQGMVTIVDDVPVPVPVYEGPEVGGPIVSIAATPTGRGSWATTATGHIYVAGDAVSHGSMSGTHLNAPIVGIAPNLSGTGYYLVASDGGIFAFGEDAKFYGSMGGTPLNYPITGMIASCEGEGYFMVARDGGVFAFGDATFSGSMGGTPINKGMVGITPNCAQGGYWTYAQDGGVFTFGQNNRFHGSLGGNPPRSGVSRMEAASDGEGYWLITGAGNIHAFGSAAAG